MHPSSVRRPSTGYDSFDEFADHSTLVHAFVMSRVNYCNLLLAGAPKSVTDKLQRVMNSAARVVSGTTHLLHSELHWLDVADRVTYNFGVTVCKCLHGQAPDYLSEMRTPVAQVAERQHLRSANRHLLVVPRFQLDTYGRHTFAVTGPTTWSLSKTICMSWTCKLTVFTEDAFLNSTWHIKRIRGVIFFAMMCHINTHLHLDRNQHLNTRFPTDQMLFVLSRQQCQSTEGTNQDYETSSKTQ